MSATPVQPPTHAIAQFLAALSPAMTYRHTVEHGRPPTPPADLIVGPYGGGYVVPRDHYACLFPHVSAVPSAGSPDAAVWGVLGAIQNERLHSRETQALTGLLVGLLDGLASAKRAGQRALCEHILEISASAEATWCDEEGGLYSAFQCDCTLYRLLVRASTERPAPTGSRLLPLVVWIR